MARWRLTNRSSTIRAFAAEARYQERFYSKVNAMLKLTWAYYMARRWIRLRFDLLSTIINATTFALVVVSNVPQGLAAIAIVWSQYMVMYCMELVQMVSYCRCSPCGLIRLPQATMLGGAL
jgi:hypothetical protein